MTDYLRALFLGNFKYKLQHTSPGHSLNKHGSMWKQESKLCVLPLNKLFYIPHGCISIYTCRSLHLTTFCGHLLPIATVPASTGIGASSLAFEVSRSVTLLFPIN